MSALRDVTPLIDTQDCTVAGCPFEAAFSDGPLAGLCREHADAKAAGRLPNLSEAERLQRAWNDDSAPVPAAACKVDGCEEPSLGATNGTYARLCREHTEDKKKAMSVIRSGAGAATSGREWDCDHVIAAIRDWHAAYGSPPTSSQWNQRHDGYPTYTEARAAIGGGWNDVMRAAGFAMLSGGWKLVVEPGPAEEASSSEPDSVPAGDADGGGASTDIEPAAQASDQDEIPPETPPEIREPEPEPEQVDWRNHPDLLFIDLGEDEPLDFMAASLEFQEAVEVAERAIRRLRAAHACIQDVSDPLVARANVLLTGSFQVVTDEIAPEGE